jgi:hypothetical protein
MFPKVLQDAKDKRDEKKRLVSTKLKLFCLGILKLNVFFDMPQIRDLCKWNAADVCTF